VRAIADDARALEAVHAGHVDIEEEKRRLVLLDHRLDVAAILHLVHDIELGPKARKPRTQLGAKQRLIVGDDGGHAAHAGTSMEATTPRGSRSSITRRADGP
jgi:hypothetical protein